MNPGRVVSVQRVTERYPSYGSTNLPWATQIPIHWEVAPLYARYEVALGKMLDSKRIVGRHLASYVRNVDVQWDRVNIEALPVMDFAPEERARFILAPGDLLVCEGGEIGRTAMWRGELAECYYQKAIHRLRPLRVADNPRFLYYVMRAAAHLGVFAVGGNVNIIDHLTAVKLRRQRLPFPPADEQRIIVGFLDRETAKIDALIAKKHQLASLAVERLHAETRALFAIKVPTLKVGWIAGVGNGSTPSRENPHYWNGATPWLTSGKVHEGTIRSADEFVSDLALGECHLPMVRSGSVLIAITGEGKTRGTPALLAIDATISQHLAYVTIRDPRVLPEYLVAWLGIQYDTLRSDSSGDGSTKGALTCDYIRNLQVPVPAVREQERIIAAADGIRQRTHQLTSALSRGVDRLREYRFALITAAVTGQIDVRHRVA